MVESEQMHLDALSVLIIEAADEIKSKKETNIISPSSRSLSLLSQTLRKMVVNLDDDFETVVYKASCRNPQSYGTIIPKKYLHDTEDKTRELPKDSIYGDIRASINNKRIGIEAKSTYISNGLYSIVQIRPFHQMEYFLLFLSDVYNGTTQVLLISKDDFLSNVTLSPAHGNKETNRENTNIEYRTSLKQEDINKLKQFNILGDTNYNDLLKFTEIFDIIED